MIYQDAVEKYSEAELAYIINAKESKDWTWQEITDRYNKKFKKDRSADTVKKAYHRNRTLFDDDAYYVKTLRDVERQRKNNSIRNKEIKSILKMWNTREEILDAVKSASADISKLKYKPKKKKKRAKNKPSMTKELLLSDIHIGKKTDDFDLEIAKRRIEQVAETTLKEIERAEVHYNVDRIIVAFIGDLIESATMHGTESYKGCEFGNSRQVYECIKVLFERLLVPLAKTGKKIECVGVTGNHDRTELDRTYHNPGEDNVTWIIYNVLKDFCHTAGFKNVSWDITRGCFLTKTIYGENVLYEHYDNARGGSIRKGLETLLADRIEQLNIPIHFMRGGHFHEAMEFGIGRIVVNGNLPGNDSFSTVKGFNSRPAMTLLSYIERRKDDRVKRHTSFYKRFLIQLN